jgi:putative protease
METQIGTVGHYFNHLSVAVLKLDKPLHVGDRIHIVGHSTDLVERVTSMEVDHHSILQVEAGADVAIKVIEPVHKHDLVLLVPEESSEPHSGC